ncbi:PH domain-containing protein [Blastococcus sp. BMG 814]|uniref:PH domain-containing protein n=1 Tax=Blastococcus carthaginiensis TaxID=3050034 RepID=A0ABT9ICA9_9ACTN|nr:PH domain-containing protein [Blastococcus carthaginiensis]MDP5183206.1 PH domain-containing protein [Blastococcus carthaginiensis]
MTPPARFRMNRSALLPVIILALCVLPTALVSPWTLLLLVIPAVVAAWVLRTGVDVGDDGITARSLLGSRTVAWSELSRLRLGGRGDVWLGTTGGTEVRLPVLRVRDLPRLAAASGGRLADPSARPADQ